MVNMLGQTGRQPPDKPPGEAAPLEYLRQCMSQKFLGRLCSTGQLFQTNHTHLLLGGQS